jgi:amino acid transporter
MLITVILMLIVYSASAKKVKTVEAWTICCLLIILIMSVIACIMWFSDKAQKLTRPVAYSPYIFPVFKYNPKKNELQKHYGLALILICTFVLGFIWALGICVLMKPV